MIPQHPDDWASPIGIIPDDAAPQAVLMTWFAHLLREAKRVGSWPSIPMEDVEMTNFILAWDMCGPLEGKLDPSQIDIIVAPQVNLMAVRTEPSDCTYAIERTEDGRFAVRRLHYYEGIALPIKEFIAPVWATLSEARAMIPDNLTKGALFSDAANVLEWWI